MIRPENLYERLIFGLVKRVPGRVVAVIALLFYPGVALIVPVALGWSMQWLINANLWGTVLAGSISVSWLFVQIEARDRRHLVEWTTELRLLDSAEFEWLVGELFRREGWRVEETGRQGEPDGNIDLRIRKGSARRVVQCKRWQSWPVGVDEVRKFAGTLMREGLPGSAGVFVTLSGFTPQAREEARGIDMTLLDSRDLHARVEASRRKEPCDRCGAPMRLNRSQHGWWFRCLKCTGKRDLGPNPARAVELLTEHP